MAKYWELIGRKILSFEKNIKKTKPKPPAIIHCTREKQDVPNLQNQSTNPWSFLSLLPISTSQNQCCKSKLIIKNGREETRLSNQQRLINQELGTETKKRKDFWITPSHERPCGSSTGRCPSRRASRRWSLVEEHPPTKITWPYQRSHPRILKIFERTLTNSGEGEALFRLRRLRSKSILTGAIKTCRSCRADNYILCSLRKEKTLKIWQRLETNITFWE